MAKDRNLSGPIFVIVVAVFSFGLAGISWKVGRSSLPVPLLLVHVCAMLCLLWSFAGHVVWRYHLSSAALPGRGVAAGLEIGAVSVGLLAAVVMAYAVVIEALFRTLLWSYEATPRLSVWPGGFIDIVMIGLALCLSWRKTGGGNALTALLWLLVLAAAWTAFQVPAFMTDSGGRVLSTHWPGLWMLLVSLVAGLFVLGTGLGHRRRRVLAWPDDLHLLAEPPVALRGIRYSVGILSAVVLLLGCSQIVRPWTAPAAIVAGASALTLAHRQWNENLADVAIALITLGVISLLVMLFPALPIWWSAPAWAEVFNRILLGLALMAGTWFWLAGVWRQQLDNGQPWTTAGRLIRIAERVGFFVAALAVLIAYHLAFWPGLPYGSYDSDAWRWGWGLTANGLLIAILLWATLKTRKSTIGWLFVCAVFAMMMFVVIRTPHGLPGRTWALYWPVVLAVTGGVLVVCASLLARTDRGRTLFEPVYLTGVAVMPLTAIAGILYRDPQIIPRWAPAETFGALVIVYLLAAMLIGPRTFAAVAVLCVGLCFWRLQEATGWLRIGLPYYYAMLLFLAAGLWAWVSQQRQSSRVMRVITWAGMTFAAASIVAGWLLSRGY